MSLTQVLRALVHLGKARLYTVEEPSSVTEKGYISGCACARVHQHPQGGCHCSGVLVLWEKSWM